MEEIKEQLKQLTDYQKVNLFEFLRDELNLKTTTEIARKYGKSYGGISTSKFGVELQKTTIGKTTYYVDRD